MSGAPNGSQADHAVGNQVGRSRTTGPARWAAALAVTALPLPVVLVTWLAWRDRLPDPMPTHWNVHGEVDGITALDPLVTALTIAAAAGIPLAALAAAVRRWSWHGRRVLALFGALVAGFGAGIWLMNAVVALDVADAYQAPPLTWHLCLMIGVALLPPAGVFLALGRAPAPAPATGRPPADAPRLDLGADERASWNEIMVPRGLVAVLVVALVGAAGLGVALGNPWATAPVVVALLVVAASFAVIRLTVDRRGLTIRFGPWRFAQVTVVLDEIEYAEVTEVHPGAWGGWGYRMRPRGRAVVLQKGPGVRLALSDNRHFVTNTRDPEAVAGLINTMVERVRKAA